MGVLNRLYKIARANTLGYFGSLGKSVGRKGERIETNSTTGHTERSGDFSGAHAEGGKGTGSGLRGDTNGIGIPKQVIEDLAVFNLKPPSSMEEVRKARNREIKKYHSDRFVNDPDRLELSKEIMQIYNAAYDRLKAYYEKR